MRRTALLVLLTAYASAQGRGPALVVVNNDGPVQLYRPLQRPAA